MFNENPPFAYENTDDIQDPTMPSYRSQAPPPGCQYHEDPYQGYAPHIIHPTTVALDHDQVTLERMSPQDAVPALYFSPKLSPAKAGELLRRGPQSCPFYLS